MTDQQRYPGIVGPGWTPKVGDKVLVVGHHVIEGPARISGIVESKPGWYWIHQDGHQIELSHIRNLEDFVEDERKGLARPPIHAGDEVEVVFRGIAYENSESLYVYGPSVHSAKNPKSAFRQIERRVQNFGRQSRGGLEARAKAQS